VKYEGVYPGVDLVYYGQQGHLEYDFIVAAGAEPKRIGLEFAGAEGVRLDSQGNLLIDSGDGAQVTEHVPAIYQEVGGERRRVDGGYELRADGRTGFRLGRYDRSRPLVIDPGLIYSTYLGGLGVDYGDDGIAVDSDGNAYVTGTTSSTNFPATYGAHQTTNAGNGDAFVTKAQQ